MGHQESTHGDGDKIWWHEASVWSWHGSRKLASRFRCLGLGFGFHDGGRVPSIAAAALARFSMIVVGALRALSALASAVVVVKLSWL